MLNTYITRVQRLLQNPQAPTSLYTTADITDYINMARGQLAGEAECIRYQATFSAAAGTRTYAFSSLSTGVAATTGIQGVIHVRSLFYSIGSGQLWVTPRSWEYFEFYFLNNAVPDSGAPQRWAQYGQGSAPSINFGGGSLYLDPLPDTSYTMTADCVCYPINLVLDADREAIPYLWTDAVPFLAAYYAYLSSQGGARQAEADRMYGYYQTYVERARKAVNPSVLRSQYEQAPQPVKPLPTGGGQQR